MTRRVDREVAGSNVIKAMVKARGLLVFLLTISGCAVQPDLGTYPEKCPVHVTPLRTEHARVVYGTPLELVDKSFAREMQESFPYPRSYAWGGCVDDTAIVRRPTTGVIHYCPDCRVAYSSALRERAGE